ncbi:MULTISPECIES: superoxide dismutase family protein [unclassified Ruminococcus]|uniref:superoxide dismutase family protein n=1 Tax=unclassified Ruminococcus TaxID=2608920 RepID=UPI00210B0917|nr:MULTISPECIES: superoxide dismutase family protein [unclassified Ruminococcus]
MYYNVYQRPFARANLQGNSENTEIKGRVTFYDGGDGVIVNVKVNGLPYTQSECNGTFMAFHLHEGKQCSGNKEDEFANAGMHYNPENCIHISHAGDFPPIINCAGYAYCEFFTNRFKVQDIIGRAVVIHENYDDFTTQPSGAAGKKIACGIVKRME